MVFSILLSAIVWNLGTWYFGLPASSSHTLIGSIMGVGFANAMMKGGSTFGEGVNWAKAREAGASLLISPLIGFVAAAGLLLLMRYLIKRPELFSEPKKGETPPLWIRGILILTCTGVSFAHGSNDGQKGMGLIMLILVGCVPTAYALNRAMPVDQMTPFVAMAQATQASLAKDFPNVVAGDPRKSLSEYVRTKELKP